MAGDFVELQRFQNGELLDETAGFLKQADIPCQIHSLAAATGTAWMGIKEPGAASLLVPRHRLAEAKAAIEGQYLQNELPADHYLLSMSTDELAALLAEPDSWSLFDVAHAGRLIQGRGVSLEQVSELRTKIQEQRRRGRPGPVWRLLLAACLAFFGPFFSVVSMRMAWSFCCMEEDGPDGRFHTYDAATRRLGKVIFALSSITTLVTLFLWLMKVTG